ncbi:hypothetical protein C483_08387 [Natrialba hulunbeirensis JCM 10989]|uniref:Uncharacterized protein n=1 Tax=Natrialba hulunbeirensis JCM 10989 TaxID=1227493 RepID=M0A1W4_9EURY|nr:hypothetical protein C483_08387 [Natrialba hulunbeirensis JCM 10989]
MIFLLWITGQVSKIGRFNVGRYFGGKLDKIQFKELRDDLVEMASNDAVKWDVVGVDQELKEIKSEGKQRHEYGELLFTSIVGILAIFSGSMNIPILGGSFHGWGIESLLLLLPIFVLIRVALLDRVAYTGADEVKTGDLEVAVKWQEMVCYIPFSIPFLLAMGLIRGVFGDSRYEVAMDIVSESESWRDNVELLKTEFSKRV